MSEFAHSEEDLSWIIPYLPINEEDKKIVELSLEPFNNSGGLSGAMKFLKVKIGDSVDQYIYKTMDNLEKSKGLGSPREALFYQVMEQKFMTDLDIGLPYVIYAHGNMATGTKVMILEDLSINGTQSGYFFGNHSPLNWGKDLAALTSVIRRKPTMEEVIRDAFATAAKIHREFWMDSSTLFQYSWLRSAGWFQGTSRATWDGNQNFGLSAWKKLKATIDSKESKVNWDENLVKTAEACFQKINWDDYQADIKTRKFTLIHGDFHPANIFWVNNKDDDDGKSVVIDWELVSIGSGPQDLAQYLISHVNPEERRSLEDSLLHHYYDCLTHNDSTGGKFVNASEYSYEECYQDFIHGGAEKWIWLLAMIGAFSPAPVAQYFQDQVASFLRDHGLNAENIGMPRV